jgi:hypothetical protein
MPLGEKDHDARRFILTANTISGEAPEALLETVRALRTEGRKAGAHVIW